MQLLKTAQLTSSIFPKKTMNWRIASRKIIKSKAFGLSSMMLMMLMMMMSRLFKKSLESRLVSKQRLSRKKKDEKIWLSQQKQAACDPLSAGWLVLKQQDFVRRPTVTPGQSVCQPVSASQTSFPDPRHMRVGGWCVGSVQKGHTA